MKLKNVEKSREWNSYLALQNAFVLPTELWEQEELLTNFNKITEICGPTDIRTRTYCLKNACPHRTAETIDLKIKIVGENTLIGKRNNPTILKEIILLHI